MQCVINSSRIPLPKPNSFAGLMELYENNYIKLKKLCDNFNDISEYSVSHVSKGLSLYLHVVERTKYTITLNLSYKFSSNNCKQPIHYPNLIIRVYFDAMQAEVLDQEPGRKKQKVNSVSPR